MVLESGELDCASEVLVIAAGLSIQDPRERPADHQAQADQLHARFADPDSDFISLMNVYRYARELRRDLSSNQFRKRLKSEYLHHLRMREWEDLVGQLRRAAKQVGIKLNHEPAQTETVHRAILSGLLSHVGLRDAARREYAGARGARFAIFPGSGLAKRQPSWAMVAELVETSRLWGRTAARIDPRWVEPLAEHLVKRTHEEPRWDRKRGAVVATERVTLYGLPIVAGRTVAYGRIDPAVSRDLFIRRALVEGDWDTRHGFLAANQAQVEDVEALEHRARRRDILVDDQVLYDFYAARIPETVVSGAHFDRWWKDARRTRPELLDFTPELLVRGDAEDALAGRPQTWSQGELELALSYHFEPGSAARRRDGARAAQDPAAPAPGRLRLARARVPAGARDHADPQPAQGRSPPAGARAGDRRARRRRPAPAQGAAARPGRARAERCASDPAQFDPSRLPAHLRMRFAVEDDDGSELAAGDDLQALKARLTPRLREALSSSTRGLERRGLKAWTIGTLPREVTLPETGDTVRAYPALVDEGGSVAVRMLESAAAQRAAMAAGTRRLLLLTVPSPVPYVASKLSSDAKLALYAARRLQAVFDDCVAAAVDALVAEAGGPAWDEASFARLRAHVAGRLAAAPRTSSTRSSPSSPPSARSAARRRHHRDPAAGVARGRARPGRPARAAGLRHRHRARPPARRRALRARGRRAPGAAARRAGRRSRPHEGRPRARARVPAAAAGWPRGRPVPAALREVPWMLEELRVSHFAQALGTRGPASSKRIRQALAAGSSAPGGTRPLLPTA